MGGYVMEEERESLVRLLDLDDEFIIDLKYATEDNFVKERVYKANECYIHKNTATLLLKAKDIFKKDGYRVKIWDAYRPISAQRRLFEIIPIDDLVETPPDMSKEVILRPSHMNGLSVDLTLVDKNGNEIEMPTKFDDFSEMASLSCTKVSEKTRKNAEYLRTVMEYVGFKSYINEWWHFNDGITPPPLYSDIIF